MDLVQRVSAAPRLSSRLGTTGLVLMAAALASGCRSYPLTTERPVPVASYEPSRSLGQLFHDIQMSGIFPDGKTFVDARPLESPADIVARYMAARGTSG